MVNSVNDAYAVLTGKLSGDQNDSLQFLQSLTPADYQMRKTAERRMSQRIKRRQPRLGYLTPRRAY